MRALNILKEDHYDFTAKYLAVSELNACAGATPECISAEALSTVKTIFSNPVVTGQTQAYFLFREAAEILCGTVIRFKGERLSSQAHSLVMELLKSTHGPSHRAISETLGSCPLAIHGPDIGFENKGELPCLSLHEIPAQWGARPETVRIMGRSMVFQTREANDFFVLKVGALESLEREAAWMAYLSEEDHAFPVRFDKPTGVTFKGCSAFTLSDLPQEFKSNNERREYAGIAFLVDRDYYTYPNHCKRKTRLDEDQFIEVMSRNAWLFGKLTSLGIVHTAPIPLFHNRIQQHRREDQGRYLWERGGRLDRWLSSCCYPNFGITGIRDFEHFISFKGSSRNLYHHIGTQLLSLILVVGSYFRHYDVGRVGFTQKGKPEDSRDLFDHALFMDLLQKIFSSYYRGFVGNPLSGDLPIDFERLTGRMIEEMGVDRYMEEIWRAVDQEEMTQEQFQSFLKENGYPDKECKSVIKGAQDLVLYTGPHLGGFNQRISVPECTEAVASMSALCIFGAYEVLHSH
jgi:hypothetical protein